MGSLAWIIKDEKIKELLKLIFSEIDLRGESIVSINCQEIKMIFPDYSDFLKNLKYLEREKFLEPIYERTRFPFSDSKNPKITGAVSDKEFKYGDFFYEKSNSHFKQEQLIVLKCNRKKIQSVLTAIEKTELAIEKEENKTIPVSFDENSGIGNAKKEFKLRLDSPNYRVFKKLYKNIGKEMSRYDVLVAAHYYEDGDDVGHTTTDTERISQIAKRLRKQTGLSTKQLVMNSGCLTLVARKLRKEVTLT